MQSVHKELDRLRILLVKPAEMGSTVMAYPALLRARELWPDCEFYFMCFQENRQVVALLEMIPDEHVFGIRTDNLFVFASDCFRHLNSLWKLKLDGSGDTEQITFFTDYPGFCASNPVVSDDGRYMSFQLAKSSESAGVGHGIFIFDFQQAASSR